MFTGFAETISRAGTSSATAFFNYSIGVAFRTLHSLFNALHFGRRAKHYTRAVYF
jgi:hypothetical protein